MSVRHRAVVVALGLCAALTTACGDSSAPGKRAAEDPGARLSAAADRVRDARSMRVSYTLRSDLDGERMSFSGRGTLDATSSRGRLSGTYTEGGDEPFAMQIVFVGDDGYVRSPSLRDLLPPGKRWLRVRDSSLTSATLTPAELLEFLREGGRVEEVGREQVRSQPTTHYRSPVDIDKLATRTSSRAARKLRRLTGDGRLPFTMMLHVWVPDDGRLSRMALLMRSSEVAGVMSMTADILEYDVPVNARRPPARIVADASRLRGP